VQSCLTRVRDNTFFLVVFYVVTTAHKLDFMITLIITNKCTYIKFYIKTLKIALTCFDHKIILRELRIETCRSDFKCFNVFMYVHLLVIIKVILRNARCNKDD